MKENKEEEEGKTTNVERSEYIQTKQSEHERRRGKKAQEHTDFMKCL